MTRLPGKFVWFEHLSGDVARARAFYEPLFGWSVASVPIGGVGYDLVMLGGQGIAGLRTSPPGVPTHWTSYLSVDDVDAAFGAAVAAGATALMPPTDFTPMGRGAALADPTGASFCLWKGAMGDREDAATVAIGDWYWNELCTPDPDKAVAFYERVFGYASESMDMGPAGRYVVLSKDGKPRAGIVNPPGGNAPPMWLPYLHVDDCDATSERARELGAQVVVPPTDIPGIGRFAVFVDPLGAAIAVIKSASQAMAEQEAAGGAAPAGA